MESGSIYWADEAPKNAAFSLYPFLLDDKITFTNRIEKLPPPCSQLKVLEKKISPEKSDWGKNIEKALTTNNLKKIVLARKTTLKLETPLNPLAITASLQSKASMGASVFCASLPDSSFLLGATPERLFKRNGFEIQVEALAGTASLQKKESLLESDKDLREFRFIEDHFQEILKPFLDSPLEFSKIETHKTATLYHLKSIGKARIKQKVRDHDLIYALHPTPALLGSPSPLAIDFLKKNEPFSRGFYGGLIGWSSEDASDWKVVIRSCHIKENLADLYVGTGIVQGSIPELEWQELEIKQSLYDGIFSCNF